MRQLWTERDPRVPPHRRIDADGRPSVDDLAARITAPAKQPPGLLAVELRTTGEVIGYCGLVPSDRTPHAEPEIAFELLQRTWGQGYATEAAEAVLEWAAAHGITSVGATVWDWNTASRAVLRKLGFAETDRTWTDHERGTAILTLRTAG